MNKGKLIIVCDGTVATMGRESALALATMRHGECIVFDSIEQFAEHVNGRLTKALMDANGITNKISVAFKELEASLEPEHDFTVSYKDYLSKGKRKNKRGIYSK